LHLVVTYDVTSNRRRSKLAEALDELLGRVQKSVFEGEIADWKLPEIKRIVMKHIDPGRDDVRIYRLCVRCRDGVERIGVAAPAQERGDEIF